METLVRNLKVKIAEFENRQVLLMIEIERLHLAINDKDKEAEDWRERVSIMNTELEKFDLNIVELKRDNESWRLRYNSLEHMQDSIKFQLEMEIKSRLVHFLRLLLCKIIIIG